MRCVELCNLKIKKVLINVSDMIDDKLWQKYVIETKLKTIIIKVFQIFRIDLITANFSPEFSWYLSVNNYDLAFLL